MTIMNTDRNTQLVYTLQRTPNSTLKYRFLSLLILGLLFMTQCVVAKNCSTCGEEGARCIHKNAPEHCKKRRVWKLLSFWAANRGSHKCVFKCESCFNLKNQTPTSRECDTECPVCLDDFDDDTKTFTTESCKHKFHTHCIRDWYNSKTRYLEAKMLERKRELSLDEKTLLRNQFDLFGPKNCDACPNCRKAFTDGDKAALRRAPMYYQELKNRSRGKEYRPRRRPESRPECSTA